MTTEQDDRIAAIRSRIDHAHHAASYYLRITDIAGQLATTGDSAVAELLMDAADSLFHDTIGRPSNAS